MTTGCGEPVRRPESFDGAAADYEAFRPPYPPEVVQTVVSVGRLQAGSRVLEIGCGTGQLSVDLARRGYALVAVEMGPSLAARAQKQLRPFPTARVEVGPFETWPLPTDSFDAVVSASAFHWLAPDVRFAKSAEALRPGGHLVIVHAHHVQGGTPGFFEDTQPFYRKWGLSDDPFFRPPMPAELPALYPELDQLLEYGSVQRHRLELPRTFSTMSYVGWLRTDSLILSLDPESRAGFLRDIAQLIDSKYHGEASRNFVYDVIGAERWDPVVTSRERGRG